MDVNMGFEVNYGEFLGGFSKIVLEEGVEPTHP